ncbi:MAG: 1-acyl-sn-glycerol-3-phosphate acyltransferase [Myxococcota bacterium]
MRAFADRIARGLAWILLRIFYRELEVSGGARVPAQGPVLVVANHGNSLIDPFLMVGFLPRMPRFLAKSTLFSNPGVAPFLWLGGVLPVYRRQDEVDTARNEETFERCFDELAHGGVIALFPEGISHDEPRLQRLKTGAARIALGAEAARGPLGLRIVPVGLTFEAKGTFRSRVLMQIGEPITPPPPVGGSEEREAVRMLTDRIDAAIRALTLDHPSWEQARLVERAAEAFSARAREMPGRETLAGLFGLRKSFAEAHERLRREAPERVERVEQMLVRYDAGLAQLGLRDDHLAAAYPWTKVALYVSDRLPVVVAVFPAAALGTLLNWVPYRLAGVVASRVERSPDLPATFKLMTSLVLFPLTWILEVALVGGALGFWPGVLMAVAAPVSGGFALLFHERHESFWSELRAWAVLRLRRGRVAEVRARRRALREEVSALLEEATEVEKGATPGAVEPDLS